jgi:hypothetical protein
LWALLLGGGALGLVAAGGASCENSNPADPDASAPDSGPLGACEGPAALADTWTAPVTEPNAAGTYAMTLEPLSGFDHVGTLVFDRDVIYGAGAPQFAGCHATTRYAGSYVAENGGMSIVLISNGQEDRQGCADPTDDVQDLPVPADPLYRDAVNGPYSLTACTLTINSLVFQNGKSPTDGGSDAGPPPCDPMVAAACYANLACYTDIFKDCIPSNTCISGPQVVMGSELNAPFCFDNGVKMLVKTEVANPFISKITKYKSGGAFCWHADSTSNSAGDNTLVYSDENGNLLATVETLSDGTQTVTCAGMAPVKLGPECGACSAPGSPGGNLMCSNGACSVP